MATMRIAVQRPKRRFLAGATARAEAVARICAPPLNCASPRPRRFVDILAFPWIPHCGARAPQSVLSLKPHYNKRRPRAGAPQVLAYANFIGKRAPGRRSASVAARRTGSGQRGAADGQPASQARCDRQSAAHSSPLRAGTIAACGSNANAVDALPDRSPTRCGYFFLSSSMKPFAMNATMMMTMTATMPAIIPGLSGMKLKSMMTPLSNATRMRLSVKLNLNGIHSNAIPSFTQAPQLVKRVL